MHENPYPETVKPSMQFSDSNNRINITEIDSVTFRRFDYSQIAKTKLIITNFGPLGMPSPQTFINFLLVNVALGRLKIHLYLHKLPLITTS